MRSILSWIWPFGGRPGGISDGKRDEYFSSKGSRRGPLACVFGSISRLRSSLFFLFSYL